MSDEARAKIDPPPAPAEGGERRSIKTDLLQSAALATFARVDFWCFVELMFPVLYPGQKLVYAGYLELIATLLMRVGQRRFHNVIINLPPRHMKSALASILYPAWRLGCDPTVKFICISYGDDLAHDLSAQTRKIMRSPEYKQIFPGTILDKSAVDHIRTTMGGYRYAIAVGSDITGFGADEIIIDDPVQPEDALSERVKQQLRDWVNSSVYTRFNDPSQGAMVLVMHRLAPDDLAGTMEPSADLVLKLPHCRKIGTLPLRRSNDDATGAGRAAQSQPLERCRNRYAEGENRAARVFVSIPAAPRGRRLGILLDRSPGALCASAAFRADRSFLGHREHEGRGRLDGVRQIRPRQGLGRPRHSLPHRNRSHANRTAGCRRGDRWA
jgi:hypothetical protein